MGSNIDFSKKVKLNSDILQKEVENNLIFCNLNNENFYKLDPFSKKIFYTLLNHNTINKACEKLISEHNGDKEIIKNDIEKLISNLLSEKIVNLESE